MKRSKMIKQSKLIAGANNKRSNSFWRGYKALCGDSKTPNETNKVLKSHITTQSKDRR